MRNVIVARSSLSMARPSPLVHFQITVDVLQEKTLYWPSHERPAGEALVLHSCSLGSGMVVAASPAPISRLHFGVFTVDPGAGELSKHGIRVKLQERPFQLLVALVERPGEVVTREELRQRLWPDGTFVDFDHSISSAINRLRSALSDSATRAALHRDCRPARVSFPLSGLQSRTRRLSDIAMPSPEHFLRYRRVAVLVGLALVVLGAGIALALRSPVAPVAADRFALSSSCR